MAGYNTNVAYKQASTAPKRQPKGKIIPMPVAPAQRKAHNTNPLKALSVLIICGIAVTVLYAMLIMNSKITEVNAQILKLDTKISQQKSEQVRLKMEIEAMMSLKNVEDYAVTELGMQKVSKNQVKFIRLNNKDKIEIKDNKKENNIFSEFGGAIANLWNT